METITQTEQPLGQADVISVKEWAVTLLITAIPIVGFVMLFVWAFGSGANPNKMNWAKGALLLLVIVMIFYLFVALLIGVNLFSAL